MISSKYHTVTSNFSRDTQVIVFLKKVYKIVDPWKAKGKSQFCHRTIFCPKMKELQITIHADSEYKHSRHILFAIHRLLSYKLL